MDISRRLEKNLLNYSALEALIQRLAVGSVGLRADRKSYIGSSNKKHNDKRFLILSKILFLISLEIRSNSIILITLLSKKFLVIVLTAHPTFGMTFQMMQDLAKLATSENEHGQKNFQ